MKNWRPYAPLSAKVNVVYYSLAQKHITEKWGGVAKLQVGRFDNLPYNNDYFDVVFDIVSLQHLDLGTSRVALKEINRVLKDKGLFFSYRLSDGSCMFMNSGGQFEDAATIDNVYPKDLPLNNNQRMSFWSPSIARMYYEPAGFLIRSIEKDTRTYQNMKMAVEYLSITAEKFRACSHKEKDEKDKNENEQRTI